MNNIIVPLKGPDRVRKRPAVIFGSKGSQGATTAVKVLIDIFVNEATAGNCAGIKVTIHKDNSVSLLSMDRGLNIDETIVDGKPSWYYNFCDFYCAPREADEEYIFSITNRNSDLFGKTDGPVPKYQSASDLCFDLCCVQMACEFMHIEVIRDGIKKTLEFEKGYSVSDVIKEKSADPSGTFIHFRPDTEVFESIDISAAEISKTLREAAVTVAGTKCEIFNEYEGSHAEYFYPEGIEDYARSTADFSGSVFVKEIEATGKDRYNRREYDARVKILFGFVTKSPKTECFHNFRMLENGGHHLMAVKTKLVEYINMSFLQKLIGEAENITEISYEDIKDKVVLIIESACSAYASCYDNAAKKAITNKMIADMASDLINYDFSHYLKQNHDAIIAILNNIKKNIP